MLALLVTTVAASDATADPVTDAQAHLTRAQTLIAEGKRPEAEVELRAALALVDWPISHLLLGQVLIESGTCQAGVPEVQRYLDAPRSQPRNAAVRRQRERDQRLAAALLARCAAPAPAPAPVPASPPAAPTASTAAPAPEPKVEPTPPANEPTSVPAGPTPVVATSTRLATNREHLAQIGVLARWVTEGAIRGHALQIGGLLRLPSRRLSLEADALLGPHKGFSVTLRVAPLIWRWGSVQLSAGGVVFPGVSISEVNPPIGLHLGGGAQIDMGRHWSLLVEPAFEWFPGARPPDDSKLFVMTAGPEFCF
jgi:hypothetical protein